jgi:hypothetical protein
MPTTQTRYVNPGADAGGDGTTAELTGANCAYQSLSIWENARNRDLTSGSGDDTIEEVICDTDGTADTTKLTITGWTTSSTNYITIKTNPSNKHAGVWDTSKYHMIFSPSTQYYGGFSIDVDYVYVDGLQLKLTPTASQDQYTINTYGTRVGADSEQAISNCILWGVPNDSSANRRGIYGNRTNGNLIVRNCIIYGYSYSGNTSNSAVATYNLTATVMKAYNCTFVDCYYGVDDRGGSTTTAKNCGASNCTTPFNNVDTTSDNSTSTPTFVGAPNYHLQSGDTTWQDQGADVSGENGGYTDDIDGDTRTGTWDIGADEYVAPSGYTMLGRYLLEVRSDGTIG